MSGNNGGEPSFGTRLLDLIAQSVIVQGLVTLTLVGAVVYMNVKGVAVDDTLSSAMMLALGFYFGSKAQQVIGARSTREG